MGRSSATRAARLGAAILTAALSMSFVSFVPASEEKEVKADFVKTKENTRLDVNDIAKPAAGNDCLEWSGSYVCFGHQGYDPIFFRVLAPSTEKYYDNATMFLDSNHVLFQKEFDNNNSGIWKDKSKGIYSDLYMYLNYKFIYDSFYLPERESIVPSVCEGYVFKGNGFVPFVYSHSTPLDGDKIFALDVYELTRPEYGYNTNSGWTHWKSGDDEMHYWLIPLYWVFGAGYFVDEAIKKSDDSTHITIKRGDDKDYFKHADVYHQYVDCRTKGDGYDASAYWTRNGSALSSNGAGLVAKNGYLGADSVDNKLGVAPAMNIDLNSVLFVSLVSGEFKEVESLYKLTLFDKYMKISVPENKKVTANRHMISVPYELSGTRSGNTDQVSILILDDKYKSMNSNGNSILYYDHLTKTHSEKDGNINMTGEGEFKLPPRFDINKWGIDYHVYMLAEDINGAYETDFSSSLVEIPRITVVNDTRLSATASPSPTDKPGTPTPVNSAVSQARPASRPASPTMTADDVTISLEKTEADVICGNALSMKAKLTGTQAGISWKSSDNSIATVDSLGVVKGKKAGNVTITATAAGKSAKCKVTVLYKDVTDYSSFWFEPTYYLTEKDVVKGYDNQSRFKPSNKCTRAQMVTFIWRLKGEPAPQSSLCKFSDVQKSDYYYKACIWGNEQGIVEGYKDGTFGPQIVCARKHAVTFLWRLAGKPEPVSKVNKFSDVNKTDYFYKATLWASEKKILAGYDDGTFRPNGNCLRRQMVTFLYKYDKYINV